MKKILSIALVIATTTVLIADNDRDEYEEKKFNTKYKLSTLKNSSEVTLYKSECASCHMAYQPEFLPKRSWRKMMSSLNNHFGVDATLEKSDEVKILNFLEKNSADSKRLYGEFEEFFESIPKNKTPLKISDIPYFKKEHRKIPKKVISQKEVKTISNCIACHKDANTGTYSERAIDIPNYGRWDD